MIINKDVEPNSYSDFKDDIKKYKFIYPLKENPQIFKFMWMNFNYNVIY